MNARWDPDQYLRFEEERARPFEDLLARVPHPSPATVVDLGCGPGNTTAGLLERWPDAHVLGVDNSKEMIDRARKYEVAGRLEFVVEDLRDWQPDGPVDVLLTSATLHWVPGHLSLLSRFVEFLAPGGVFAFQVPGNFRQPSHTLLEELAASERWKDVLGTVVPQLPSSAEPSDYMKGLLAAGARPDVWETTYLHVLRGPDAVLEWISGTGLRPVLAALEAGDRSDAEDFRRSYAALLRAAYPRDSEDRTIFPFRRIFGVALV